MSDFAQLERVSRRALRMYDLTERERRIADVIIEWSFGREKEEATIHELDAFVDLTGIAREDVSRTLKLLMARRIVQRRGPRGSRTYAFLPFAAYWQETRPLFDVERATMRAVELDRINTQGKLPVEEADLDDGLAMSSREEALVEEQEEEARKEARLPRAKDSRVCDDSQMGNLPTTGGVGKLPISGPAHEAHAYARAGDVLQYSNTQNVLQYVSGGGVGKTPTTKSRSFSDPEKNYTFELVEKLAARSARDRDDFVRNRFNWVKRVRDNMRIVREAAGIVRGREENPQNKRREPIGAVLFRECVNRAKVYGKEFRLW